MTFNVRRARELMERARAEHFAVGAFNADNQETLLAIVRAAHPDEYAVVKLIGPVIAAVQDVVESRIEAFGATGKARP